MSSPLTPLAIRRRGAAAASRVRASPDVLARRGGIVVGRIRSLGPAKPPLTTGSAKIPLPLEPPVATPREAVAAALRVAVTGTRGLPASHGGVERAVESLAREGALAGHRITVYGRRGYCDADHGVEGVEQIVLPTIATKHLEALVHTLMAVGHIIVRRDRYDVVHVHATGPVMVASLLRLARIPFVATVHGLDHERDKWGPTAAALLRLAARTAATVPNATIVVSEQLQQALLAQYGRQTDQIGNGVDFDELRGAQVPLPEVGEAPFVLYLGRLVPEKQIDLLIQAFATLDSPTRLVIAGAPGNDLAYADRLRRLAAQDPRVVLVGPRYGGEKAWLMHRARVVVLPSNLEGLPIVALEALACGAQLLASDLPQNVQAMTVAGQQWGRTFRRGDAADLAAELGALLAAPGRLLPDARGIVDEHLDWARFARQTEAVYRRVVDGHTAQLSAPGRRGLPRP